MVILGEFGDSITLTTSYSNFYSSMIKLPYLGNLVPIVLPALVVGFSLLFAVLSIFKMKNKALNAFKAVGTAKSKDGKPEELSKDRQLVENIL